MDFPAKEGKKIIAVRARYFFCVCVMKKIQKNGERRWKKKKKEKREQGDDQWIFAQNVMKENLRHFSSFCQMPMVYYDLPFPGMVCMEHIFAIVKIEYTHSIYSIYSIHTATTVFGMCKWESYLPHYIQF